MHRLTLKHLTLKQGFGSGLREVALARVGRGVAIAIALVSPGAIAASLPAHAQSNPPPSNESSATPAEEPLEIPPAVLAEIREAPFSQVFPVADGQAFGVKDKDYTPSEPSIGVFTLWGDVPTEERLRLVVKYCVPNSEIAKDGATLAQVDLMDSGKILVTIDQVVQAEPAYLNEIRPAQESTVYTSFYVDPFYDPYYYNSFRLGIGYSPTTYIPAVECSTGTAVLDLMPVQDALRNLPTRTLQMRLLFSNGIVENWHLGGGTAAAIQELPTLKNSN